MTAFLTRVVERLDPDGFTSGGAMGIDTLAKAVFTKMYPERPIYIFYPQVHTWNHPRGFKWRNILVAETCDYLIRITHIHSTTYGSGWTANHAELLGKRVERYVLDNGWEFHLNPS